MNPQELFRALAPKTASEEMLRLAYELAVSNITNYTRASGDVEELFPSQVVSLALHNLSQLNNPGIQSYSQGNRSVSFLSDIPDHIKANLPRYIKGW